MGEFRRGVALGRPVVVDIDVRAIVPLASIGYRSWPRAGVAD